MGQKYCPSYEDKMNMIKILEDRRCNRETFAINFPGTYRKLNIQFEDYTKYKLDRLWQLNIVKKYSSEPIGVLAISFIGVTDLVDKIIDRLNNWDIIYPYYKQRQ